MSDRQCRFDRYIGGVNDHFLDAPGTEYPDIAEAQT